MDLLPYESLMRKLREKRRTLGLQQKRVAAEAGVSPAHLSRMENGAAEAKYSTVHAVWETLDRHERERRETAADVATREVVWADAAESVRSAWRTMLDGHYSQLPVRCDGRTVGSVTERCLVDADHEAPVASVMTGRFVEVPPETGRETLAALLRDGNRAVMVRDGAEYLGIVTAADLI